MRKRLLAGLLTLLPIGVAFWECRAIFDVLLAALRLPMLGLGEPSYWIRAAVSLVALLALLALLVALGALSQHYLGQKIKEWTAHKLTAIPWLNALYGGARQITESLEKTGFQVYRRTVLVQLPDSTMTVVGLVVEEDNAWALDDGGPYVTVFIPAAPNSGMGLLTIIKEADTVTLEATPQQALAWTQTIGVKQQ